ncbi:hypothetical protein HMPREF0322_01147 [Desulfitobacterium hafniense DP7]|uniref:Uncharacterized protein n=1 Tax=Desulfitobacterium hafniense DP7 TaxID=537010 RepID=G9XJL6_DESHA|nr:hypothetical protein HMPREF0322_01147 [Desulfitobacterium hafniense DP7]
MTPKAVRIAAQWVPAPDQHILRWFPARIIVTQGQTVGIVVFHVSAAQNPAHHRHAGNEAGPAAVGMDDSFAAENVQAEGSLITTGFPAGAGPDGDGVDAPFFRTGLIIFHDDVVGLIPGNALPLVFAALADPFHGILDPIGMIEIFLHGQAADAKTAFGDGVIRVALHFLKLAIFNENTQAATHPVTARGRPGIRTIDFGAVRQLGHSRGGFFVPM